MCAHQRVGQSLCLRKKTYNSITGVILLFLADTFAQILFNNNMCVYTVYIYMYIAQIVADCTKVLSVFVTILATNLLLAIVVEMRWGLEISHRAAFVAAALSKETLCLGFPRQKRVNIVVSSVHCSRVQDAQRFPQFG